MFSKANFKLNGKKKSEPSQKRFGKINVKKVGKDQLMLFLGYVYNNHSFKQTGSSPTPLSLEAWGIPLTFW